jgi:arylsulfatase A-like enzyme
MSGCGQNPNVVFILADDMGYGDFGFCNDGLTDTPALDRLAREGVCCSQHYAASPVCNPSRAALMTGRYPHRTGSTDTLEWLGLERLALRETTLADVLKAAGYATGLVGKWHLGAYDARFHPCSRGFDESVCFRGGMHDYYAWRLEFNRTVTFSDGRYLTDVFSQEAVHFVERHRHEPFFLSLNYNAPHTPLQCPPEDEGFFANRAELNPGVRTLYGMIRCMDRGIERILETLDRLGLAENTIVVFTSDNGPQFGLSDQILAPHDRFPLARFNCGLRGAKGQVYEGGVKVPLLIRWPAGLHGYGREHVGLIHGVDWFPTLLSACGVRRPTELALDGVDQWSALSGVRPLAVPPRFWQWNRYTPVVESNAAIRDGDWKLVRPAIREAMEFEGKQWLRVSMYAPEYFIDHGLRRDLEPQRTIPPPQEPELYNLAADPAERNNLAQSEPGRLRQMLVQLENWFESVETDRRTIKN